MGGDVYYQWNNLLYRNRINWLVHLGYGCSYLIQLINYLGIDP